MYITFVIASFLTYEVWSIKFIYEVDLDNLVGKDMNKKIFIGSIMAIVILILASFPSVVASQSIKQSDVFDKLKLIENNPDQIQEFLKLVSLNSRNPKINNL